MSRYLDDELDAARCGELEAHVVACVRCRNGLAHLREEVARVGALARVRVPEHAVRALMEQTRLIAVGDPLPVPPSVAMLESPPAARSTGSIETPDPPEPPPWLAGVPGAALPWVARRGAVAVPPAVSPDDAAAEIEPPDSPVRPQAERPPRLAIVDRDRPDPDGGRGALSPPPAGLPGSSALRPGPAPTPSRTPGPPPSNGPPIGAPLPPSALRGRPQPPPTIPPPATAAPPAAQGAPPPTPGALETGASEPQPAGPDATGAPPSTVPTPASSEPGAPAVDASSRGALPAPLPPLVIPDTPEDAGLIPAASASGPARAPIIDPPGELDPEDLGTLDRASALRPDWRGPLAPPHGRGFGAAPPVSIADVDVPAAEDELSLLGRTAEAEGLREFLGVDPPRTPRLPDGGREPDVPVTDPADLATGAESDQPNQAPHLVAPAPAPAAAPQPAGLMTDSQPAPPAEPSRLAAAAPADPASAAAPADPASAAAPADPANAAAPADPASAADLTEPADHVPASARGERTVPSSSPSAPPPVAAPEPPLYPMTDDDILDEPSSVVRFAGGPTPAPKIGLLGRIRDRLALQLSLRRGGGQDDGDVEVVSGAGAPRPQSRAARARSADDARRRHGADFASRAAVGPGTLQPAADRDPSTDEAQWEPLADEPDEDFGAPPPPAWADPGSDLDDGVRTPPAPRAEATVGIGTPPPEAGGADAGARLDDPDRRSGLFDRLAASQPRRLRRWDDLDEEDPGARRARSAREPVEGSAEDRWSDADWEVPARGEAEAAAPAVGGSAEAPPAPLLEPAGAGEARPPASRARGDRPALLVAGAVTLAFFVVGLLSARTTTPITATGGQAQPGAPASTASSAQGSAASGQKPGPPAAAPAPSNAPAPSQAPPAAPAAGGLTNPQAIGDGGSGWKVAAIRSAAHPGYFRVVFDLSGGSGTPKATVGTTDPTTLIVAFQGADGGLSSAAPSDTSTVSSITLLPTSPIPGTTAYQLKLTRPATTTPSFVEGPLRFVLDLT